MDGVDFGIWQANYLNNVGGAAMIPERGTLALLLLGDRIYRLPLSTKGLALRKEFRRIKKEAARVG